MGAKGSKTKDLDKISNLSLYEYSLNFKSEKSHESPKNQNREELIKELKEEVILPVENEYTESPEVVFQSKEELKIKDFFENKLDEDDDDNDYLNKFFPEDLLDIKRSKTFVPKPVILKAPRLHSKASDNLYITPFKLSSKSYGIVPKWNEKPNPILSEFQKDQIDCKSCNDKDELLEEFLLYADTEKTTPNVEDLQDLLNCRKKMIKFRNSINDKPYNEYENILSSEDIFKKKHHKKKSFWNKHIKFQLNKHKSKSITHDKRFMSESFPDVEIDNYKPVSYKGNGEDSEDKKDEEKEDKKEEDKDEGLFILGIIESAARERKRTRSVVVK
jgi:hypothetical protein